MLVTVGVVVLVFMLVAANVDDVILVVTVVLPTPSSLSLAVSLSLPPMYTYSTKDLGSEH